MSGTHVNAYYVAKGPDQSQSRPRTFVRTLCSDVLRIFLEVNLT